MKHERLHFPVEQMSRIFEVSRSGFYAWLKRQPSRRQQEDERLKVAIKALRIFIKTARERQGVTP